MTESERFLSRTLLHGTPFFWSSARDVGGNHGTGDHHQCCATNAQLYVNIT